SRWCGKRHVLQRHAEHWEEVERRRAVDHQLASGSCSHLLGDLLPDEVARRIEREIANAGAASDKDEKEEIQNSRQKGGLPPDWRPLWASWRWRTAPRPGPERRTLEARPLWRHRRGRHGILRSHSGPHFGGPRAAQIK